MFVFFCNGIDLVNALSVNVMKSAWELAMERLDAEDPEAGKALTDEKKAELAEIDAKYDAKIAERKIFLEKALNEAAESLRCTAAALLDANAKDMGFQQIIRAGESRIYIPSAADKRLDKLIEIAERIGYEGDDSLKH